MYKMITQHIKRTTYNKSFLSHPFLLEYQFLLFNSPITFDAVDTIHLETTSRCLKIPPLNGVPPSYHADISPSTTITHFLVTPLLTTPDFLCHLQPCYEEISKFVSYFQACHLDRVRIFASIFPGFPIREFARCHSKEGASTLIEGGAINMEMINTPPSYQVSIVFEIFSTQPSTSQQYCVQNQHQDGRLCCCSN